MSAHRIYCYDKQRVAVESYLSSLGVEITPDVPHLIRDADEARGLDHITFITIDNHPSPVPQSLWNTVVEDGALVIHVDEQFSRTDSQRKVVPVRHYEPGKSTGVES